MGGDTDGFVGIAADQPAGIITANNDVVIGHSILQTGVGVGQRSGIGNEYIAAAADRAAVHIIAGGPGRRAPAQVNFLVACAGDGQIGDGRWRSHHGRSQHQYRPTLARHGNSQ